MTRDDDLLHPDIKIPVDVTLYPLEVVYRVCYVLTDRCYVWLERTSDTTITVALTPKVPSSDLVALSGEFGNLLIDYAVRHDIGRKTAGIQEAVFRTAFSRR
jgi:His-Xaa-Ser system protein HxsD